MINLCLPDNYTDNDDIKEIFYELSKEISRRLEKIEDVNIFYSDKKIIVDENEILKFLLAKDFYNYTFKISDTPLKVISDFLSLPCGNQISSLINPRKNTNELYLDFYNSYKNTNFIQKLNAPEISKQTLKEKFKCDFIQEHYSPYNYIKEIFAYKNLKCNRASIMKSMNVSVCPYCNMNYILNFSKRDGKDISTADLDHFYVKSIRPEYTLCIYNFVPSCQICNSRLKGDYGMDIENYLYPHIDFSFDCIQFSLSNLIEVMTSNCSPNIHVENKNNRARNSTELFEIEKRYNELNQIAKDLLEKSIIYNNSYNEELSKLIIVGDVKSLVFGKKLSENEILNTSLGKFKNDLLKQFGIFK